MSTMENSFVARAFRLPGMLPGLINLSFHRVRLRRRRQATADLIHASPHLRRDIGLLEEHFPVRRR